MLRNAFMPTIILPTRIEKKLAHYWITYFIIPKHLEAIYFLAIFVDISDHLANFSYQDQSKHIKRGKMCEFSVMQINLKENLSKIDWTNELKSKTVNEAMSFFYQTSTKAYNKSFPIVKLLRKRAEDKPWITSGLKSSTEKKHILYRRFLLDQSEKKSFGI